MNIRNVVKRPLGIILYCIVAASLTWTFLTALVFYRVHSKAKTEPMTRIIVTAADSIQLPTINITTDIQKLMDEFWLFSEGQSDSTSLNSLPSGTLMSSSIYFISADSTYFFRSAYIKDCGCPAKEKGRYEIDIKFINPSTGGVFQEVCHKGLSAEDVKQFDCTLNLRKEVKQ